MEGIGPNKREAAAAVRRAQLLEVALELFAEVGIERATIKMLAERVGMSAGLLYHYFRSKEELVQAVLDNHSFDEKTQRIYQQVETLGVEEALRQILWETLQLHWRHKEALWILFREMHTPGAQTALNRFSIGRQSAKVPVQCDLPAQNRRNPSGAPQEGGSMRHYGTALHTKAKGVPRLSAVCSPGAHQPTDRYSHETFLESEPLIAPGFSGPANAAGRIGQP